MYTLAQLHRLHTKEFLIFCIANDPPPLKANLFLSFQTVQNIHNGMEFQIFQQRTLYRLQLIKISGVLHPLMLPENANNKTFIRM